MPRPKLIDKYNRHLNYLRISITDRCNLRCLYCMPRELIPLLHHDDILRYEEILRLVRISVELGITKIRITGGEPLVRKGVCDFIAGLQRIQGLSDIALTTNGVLLGEHLEKIRSAGIKRLNISLDTLDRDKFARLTGKDAFDRVWTAIHCARAAGFDPLKINVVALRGINENELIEFARLSLRYPFHIRFIEHMPIGKSGLQNGRPLLIPEIKQRLEPLGPLKVLQKSQFDGPAERCTLEGARGEIGFIGALSRHFCRTCNRLRLTASGQLRPCLLSSRQLDVKGPMRAGSSDEQLADLFHAAVENKPSNHCLAAEDSGAVTCQMSSIGG